MKIKKTITINFIILIALIIIYKLLEYILRINNLAFMNSVIYVFSGICYVLIFLMMIQAIVGLCYIVKNKILKLFIGTISSVLILVLFYGTFLISALTYEPEHIVEKEGKKMVAYVNSFLQVQVNYYDYVNQLVRGNKLKIYEDYGNGGYDPFEREEMPLVNRYTYYDDNGNVIKSKR